MATYEAKLTSKGQLTLPTALRSALRVDAGDKILFSRLPDGSFRLEPKNRPLTDLRGIVKSGANTSGDEIEAFIAQARGGSMSKSLSRAVRKRGSRE